MAMSDDKKLFLAVVAFLILKGLLDAKDANDKQRVQDAWDRVKGSKKPEDLPLFRR